MEDDGIITQGLDNFGRFDCPFPFHTCVVVEEEIADFTCRDILVSEGGREGEEGGEGGSMSQKSHPLSLLKGSTHKIITYVCSIE